MNRERLIVKIDELRKRLYELIIKEGSLLNFKVIEASQQLDVVLNEYNSI